MADVKLFVDETSSFPVVECVKTSTSVLNKDFIKNTGSGRSMDDVD